MYIESLEGRIQCDATYSAATRELIVTGTGGNDTLRVFLNGSNRIDVTQNGVNLVIKRGATSSADVGPGEVNGIIIQGLDGNDTLENALPSNVRRTTRLQGGNGNDNLFGGYGNDDFFGGAGTDTANYSRRTNTFFSVTVDIDNAADDGSQGTAEQDNVTTDVENLTGTSGADKLVANSRNNVIEGGPGNDFIQGYDLNARGFVIGGSGAGLDTYRGGSGNDVIDARGPISGGNTSTTSKTIEGGDGNDRMYGARGNDLIRGGNGNDWMRGSSGGDDFDGGAGTDTVNYDDRDANVQNPNERGVQVSLDNVANDGAIDSDPNAGGGTGTMERDNVRTSVENIEGSGNADVLVGSAAANRITGGDGNDRITGNGGADVLIGGFDSDRLIGGFAGSADTSADRLFGDLESGGFGSTFRNQDRARQEPGDVLRNIEGLI